ALSYDLDGRLQASTVDPEGLALQTTYTWDGLGQQLTVTEGAGTSLARVTAYGYDGLGRRTSETAAAGTLNLTTQYLYDANDNVVATTDPANHVTRFVYDEAGRVTFSVDARGSVTEHRYDAAGQRTATRSYANLVAAGTLPQAATDAQIRAQLVADDTRDRQSYFVYDQDGRQTALVDGAGAVTLRTLDAAGNAVQVRTFASSVAMDSVLRQQLVAGTIGAAELTQSLAANDSNDRLDSYLYDTAGRQVGHLDGGGYYTQTTYDYSGRVVLEERGSQRLPLDTHARIAAAGANEHFNEELYYFNFANDQDGRTEYLYDDGGRLVFKLTFAKTDEYPYWGDGANT
ncbi:MAG: hypothetical protein ACRER5_14590, partial [Pseudomonas sp.]